MKSQKSKMVNNYKQLKSYIYGLLPNSKNHIICNIIKRFTGGEHILQVKLIMGKEIDKKWHKEWFKVTQKMDEGIEKYGIKNHRRYGHNQKFISDNFKKREEKICAYTHLLGDFCQDVIRLIVKRVGQEFKANRIKPPHYEHFKNKEWDWDIKEKAIDNLAKECSIIFIKTLKNRRKN